MKKQASAKAVRRTARNSPAGGRTQMPPTQKRDEEPHEAKYHARRLLLLELGVLLA